jgi:hypothetical protein
MGTSLWFSGCKNKYFRQVAGIISHGLQVFERLRETINIKPYF